MNQLTLDPKSYLFDDKIFVSLYRHYVLSLGRNPMWILYEGILRVVRTDWCW